MTKFVSLFSGAGGLDIGLERAGWDCLFATDIDHLAIATLRANRGNLIAARRRAFEHAVLEQGDIRDTTGAQILQKAGAVRGEVELLAGGPPCQSWSSAGHQKGFEDPRGQLVEDYLRIATQLDVRWLMFENVRGLLTARGPDGIPGSALEKVRRSLLANGWQTHVELLNAADYGVAQRRVRLILFGYRAGDAPPMPHATHACDEQGLRGKNWISLGECLSNIRPPLNEEVIRPSGKMALELQHLPPGTGAKSPGKRETTRPGGHWGYKQGAFIADLCLPARTVTASAQQDWIRDPVFGLRRLSPRECSAIQSFPPNWWFEGKRTDQYRLIGNAVPPLLAEHLGRSLREHVLSQGNQPPIRWNAPSPLPNRLQSAIDYTLREERRNGQSRKEVSKGAVGTALIAAGG